MFTAVSLVLWKCSALNKYLFNEWMNFGVKKIKSENNMYSMSSITLNITKGQGHTHGGTEGCYYVVSQRWSLGEESQTQGGRGTLCFVPY